MNYNPVFVNAMDCFMFFEGDDKKEPHRLPHNIYRHLIGYSTQGDGWLGYRSVERAMQDLKQAMEKAQ